MEAARQTVLRVTARLYQKISAQLILILGFLGLVYFLVYFTVNSNYARRMFDEVVNTEFKGAIQFGRINWGPLPWKVRIADARLVGPQGEMVIAADSVQVRDIQLMGLLSGRIHAKDIVLSGVEVDLRAEVKPNELDEMGRPRVVFNIEEMFWPPGGPTMDEDGEVDTGPHLIFEDATILDANAKISAPGYLIEGEALRMQDGRFELDLELEDGMSMAAEAVRIERGRVRVDLEEGPGGQKLLIPFTDLQGRHYHWVESVFGMASVTLKTRDDPVTVKPFKMDLNTPDLPSMAVSVNVASSDVAKHLSPLGIDGISGPAKIVANVSGELDALKADYSVSGAGLKAMGQVVDRWNLVGQLDADMNMQVDSFLAEAYGGTLTGRFELDPLAGDLAAWVDYLGVDVARLPLDLGPEVLDLARGPIQGRMEVRAASLYDESRRVSASTTARLRREGPAAYGLGRNVKLEALVGYRDQRMQVRDFTAEVDGDRVTSSGALDFGEDEIRLSGRFSLAEIRGAAAAFGVDAEGRASGRYTVRGPLTNPRIEIDFGVQGLRYENYPKADVIGTLEVAGGRIALKDIAVRSPLGGVAVKGSITGDRLDLRVDGRRIDLADLPLELPIGGTADAKIHITGSTQRPTIAIEGVVEQPRFRGLEMDRVVLDGKISGDRLEFETLEVHDAMGRLVSAQGRVDLRRKTYSGRLKVDRASLGLIEQVTGAELPVQGVVSVDLVGEGTFDDPAGEGTITVDNLRLGEMQLGRAKLAVRAVDRRVGVEGDLFGDFEVALSLPISADGGPARGSIAFADLSLDKYVEALRGVDLTTELSGQLVFEADLFEAQLNALDLTLTEAKAAYSYRDSTGRVVPPPDQPTCATCPTVVLANAGDIKLSYREGTVTFDQVAFKAADQRLEITGTLREDGLLDVDISGGLDLKAIQPFVAGTFTGVEGQGKLNLELNGFVQDPTFFGTVVVDEMLLLPRSPTVGSEIRLMEPVEFQVVPPYGPQALPEGGIAPPKGVFTVSLPPTRLRGGEPEPNRFRLWRDDAEITVTRVGIYFEDYAPQSLLVSADGNAVAVNVPEVLRAVVNLDDVRFEMWNQPLRLRRPETRLRISGDVYVLQGAYTADIQSASDINQGFRDNLLGERRASTVSAFERVPLLKRLMLDLRVNADNDMRVENSVTVLDLELEVRMRLALKGFLYQMPGDAPEEALRIAGFIEVLEDSKIVYGRRDFEVVSGRVIMGSGNPGDLETRGDFLVGDVEATHTFRLRTGQGLRSTNFAQGLAGDVRLEEVTLTTSVRMPTMDSDPEINLAFASSSGASQIDVATLVLTGSYPSNLTGAASAQPATEVLLGPLLNLIERPLEETLQIDLTLTPATTGTLFIDADKLLSTRLRLYTSTPVGTDDPTDPQTFGLEYRINNFSFADLTNQQFSNLNSTSGRLRLRLSLD